VRYSVLHENKQIFASKYKPSEEDVEDSMFPRFLMPIAMQKAGLFTINAWAIDGFTKVFWRDLPVSALWPQVAVLLGIGTTLFLIARHIARRWEFA
jgi:ABC-2 type transport system permease protein